MTDHRGRFVWYELMTTDVSAAADFYGKVVGWTAKDSGMPGMDYRLFHSGESMVAGLMVQPEESRKMGTPPSWLGYVAVDDVDTASKEVAARGGSVFVEPRDIPGIGRFSVVGDPQQAVIALFTGTPGQEPPPPPPPGAPGQVGWHELYANDWEAALSFYAELFGWKKDQAIDIGAMGTYQLFALGSGGPAIGGMWNKPKEIPATFWLYYFNVEAIDAGVERVKANGGTITNGPMEVPGGAWIVQGMDPQGAAFALTAPRK
jgi:uncharacterized protein